METLDNGVEMSYYMLTKPLRGGGRGCKGDETMGTIIIGVILAVIVIFALRSAIHKAKYGGGCCGEREAAEKKVKVADKNKKNYPYVYELEIDGMTCSNCSARVENALNRLDGVWAQADFGTAKAVVRMKQPADEHLLRKTITDAGYVLVEVAQK